MDENEPVSNPATDPRVLIRCALVHAYWTVPLGIVFGVIGGLAAYAITPAPYTATSMIRIGQPTGIVEARRETSNEERVFRHTQEELLRLPHVLTAAASDPKLRSLMPFDEAEAVEWLSEDVLVDLPRSSQIMRISLSDEDPSLAQAAVNSLSLAYLAETTKSDRERSLDRLDELDRLQSDVENRLSDAWEELQELASLIGSGDPTALTLQAQAETENYRSYARELRSVRTEIRETERVIRNVLESPELLSSEMTEEASMHSVRYALFTANLKIELARSRFGDDHPSVVSAKKEADLLKEYYQKSAAEELEEEPKDPREKVLAEPRAKLARLSNEERALLDLMAEIEGRLIRIGGENAARLEIVRHRISRLETFGNRLWQTRELLQVEKHAQPRVTLISLASLPKGRDQKKRMKMAMMGFGAMAAPFVMGGMILEVLRGRMLSPSDLKIRCKLTCGGVLDVSKNKAAQFGTETQLDPEQTEKLAGWIASSPGHPQRILLVDLEKESHVDLVGAALVEGLQQLGCRSSFGTTVPQRRLTDVKPSDESGAAATGFEAPSDNGTAASESEAATATIDLVSPTEAQAAAHPGLRNITLISAPPVAQSCVYLTLAELVDAVLLLCNHKQTKAAQLTEIYHSLARADVSVLGAVYLRPSKKRLSS